MSKGMNMPGKGNRKMNFERAKDTKGTLKRLWKYIKVYKFRIAIVLSFIFIYSMLNALSTAMLTPIIDNYITPMILTKNVQLYMPGFIKLLISMLAIVIATGISQYVQARNMLYIAQNTVANMRTDLFKKIEKLPIKYFDEHKYGELMSRITNDLDNVTNSLNTSVNQIISGILTIISTLIMMIYISRVLTIVSVISIPVMIIVVKNISKIVRKQFVKQQECLANVNGYIEEYISGQKVIKAFNKEDDIKANFDIVNEKLKNEGFKANAFSAVVMPINGSINNISNAITGVVAGILAIAGKISIGNIATFNKYVKQLGMPINEISNQFNVIQSGIAGAERMFEIIDEEVEFPDNVDKPELGDVKGKVIFKDVSFEYEEGKPILKDINIEANPGEMIAIVGPTGAGKTTIINLLTRFYDINKGEILIDGKNIKDIDKYSLRNALGIVLQDTVLFSETIKENIKFGKLDATDEEIIEASKLANAHSFIKRLPNGYDTYIREDANNVSVGQKQLLNIARVILNDPEILILDEATSNVDTRTEVKIQEAMRNLLKGRTSFVIAHRLSTIKNADKILVINNGNIVEQGNHDELINKKGMYYNMYNGMFDNKEE